MEYGYGKWIDLNFHNLSVLMMILTYKMLPLLADQRGCRNVRHFLGFL
jgi:hypothetical protein